MNDYGFDYMNYITNVPGNINYSQKNMGNMNYMMNTKDNKYMKDMPINPNEGWMKGNLFANLYDPYKNYKPGNIDAKNEREALLYQVMQYKFALIELNLYLDTNPDDRNAIEIFNKYSNIEKQMCMEYERKYGPLVVEDTYLNNGWTWINSPWPWEVM
jgi:spore coat protein JB